MLRLGIIFTVLFTPGIHGGFRDASFYIDLVNNANTTWKAGHNFDNTSSEYIRKFTGTLLTDFHLLPRVTSEAFLGGEDIPKSFDAHAKWPNCPHIKHVRDQGACGSCWAVSAAAVLTDRLCIASKGKFKKPISAEELITCCDTCSPVTGCQGGSQPLAWVYAQQYGLVTGGDYHSHIGCQPYQLQPCGHIAGSKRVYCGTLLANTTTPKCSKGCLNPFYKKQSFADDHHKVKSASLIMNDEKAIMREIMTNGPVAAAFKVYSDFAHYKSGVYQRVSNKYDGGHGVKIIGWGTEGGVDYWLVVNSWNTDWGDLKGLFKIRRMQNGVDFEAAVTFPIV